MDKTCGDLRVAMSEQFVEVLDFPYFCVFNYIGNIAISFIFKVCHKGLNMAVVLFIEDM